MQISKLKWMGIFLIVTFVAIVVCIRYWDNPTKDSFVSSTQKDRSKLQANGTPKDPAVERMDPLTAFKSAFQTPIEFYGKVEDQYGEPVSGATVIFLPIDSAGDSSNTKKTSVSDAEGKFSVKGLKGLSLGVHLSKDGYLTLPNLGFENPASSRQIDFGLSNTGGARFKNPARPTLFTLHKIGPIDPIFYAPSTLWALPVDGSIRRIALDSINGEGPHEIEFRFSSDWGKLPKTNESYGKIYDWSFEARIPGGGFVTSDSDYAFEAPATDYQESIRFEYSSTMQQEQWKRSRRGRFFVKFPDGSFARIRIKIDSASDATSSALSLTSWLNLKVGSRNLSSSDKDGVIMHSE